MHRRGTITLTAALTGTALALAGCTAQTEQPEAPDASTAPTPTAVPEGTAAELADRFLADWVEDGRVIRRDQGGDTVSEGQAYGLLIALIAEDEQSFDRIWRWTEEELLLDSGMLAWDWEDGAVVDDEPATDADLDAARALVIAGERFAQPEYTEAGLALADAILEQSTAETALGRVLLPGPWAADRTPYAYNPSYASPAAFTVLGEASGDPRWAELSEGAAAIGAVLLDDAPLPPDWAQVHEDGTIDAMPGARGEGLSVRYGYEAARLPIREAESCEPGDRDRAAALLPALARTDDLAAETDLGGTAITEDRHPLTVLGRAAASAAAGDDSAAEADLATASELQAATNTYYGASWLVLGTAMLRDGGLDGCPPLAD